MVVQLQLGCDLDCKREAAVCWKRVLDRKGRLEVGEVCRLIDEAYEVPLVPIYVLCCREREREMYWNVIVFESKILDNYSKLIQWILKICYLMGLVAISLHFTDRKAWFQA